MGLALDRLEIVATAGGSELTVKVVPGASRTRIVGVLGTDLKLAVTSSPQGGQANAAVTELLATVLRVRRQQVTVVAGHTHPRKRIAVAALPPDEVRQRLAAIATG